MRERAAQALFDLYDRPNACDCREPLARHMSGYCEGWQDCADRAEQAVRALEVEP